MDNEEIELYLSDYEEQLEKCINHLSDELLQIRAGRANPKLIERVLVDYYGTMTPIEHMGTVSVPEPRMVLVNVWDQSMVKTVVKAIESSNLGLNPSDDGRVIRLVFPQLTEERRRDLVKEIGKLVEESKITARNSRRDCLDEFKELKKNSQITEDDMSAYEKDIQSTLDKYIKEMDDMSKAKEKEVMEV